MGKIKDTIARKKHALDRTLELPPEALGELRIVLFRGEVLIENHSGVLECLPDRVKLAAKDQEIIIEGSGLELTMFQKEDLRLSGTIHAVHMARRT